MMLIYVYMSCLFPLSATAFVSVQRLISTCSTLTWHLWAVAVPQCGIHVAGTQQLELLQQLHRVLRSEGPEAGVHFLRS